MRTSHFVLFVTEKPLISLHKILIFKFLKQIFIKHHKNKGYDLFLYAPLKGAYINELCVILRPTLIYLRKLYDRTK